MQYNNIQYNNMQYNNMQYTWIDVSFFLFPNSLPIDPHVKSGIGMAVPLRARRKAILEEPLKCERVLCRCAEAVT
eukprot:SAG31_NODE_853_length_11512_cov_42.663279_2_plen_75_part_00